MREKSKTTKPYRQLRGWFLTCKLTLLLPSLAIVVVLIWLRLDWGLTNWAPQAYLPNFWSGVYIMFAGCCLLLLDSLVATCATITGSIRLLVTTQVIGLTGVLLQLVGLTCLLADSLGKPVTYIQDLVLGLLDPDQGNNIVAKEAFLDHLYRIVGCCGAFGAEDYSRYGRSPPSSCIDRYHAGALFFKDGCGQALSTYMRNWCAGLGAGVLLFLILEVVSSILAYRLVRIIKKKLHRTLEDYSLKPLPPLPATNHQAGDHGQQLYDIPSPELAPHHQQQLMQEHLLQQQLLEQQLLHEQHQQQQALLTARREFINSPQQQDASALSASLQPLWGSQHNLGHQQPPHQWLSASGESITQQQNAGNSSAVSMQRRWGSQQQVLQQQNKHPPPQLQQFNTRLYATPPGSDGGGYEDGQEEFDIDSDSLQPLIAVKNLRQAPSTTKPQPPPIIKPKPILISKTQPPAIKPKPRLTQPQPPVVKNLSGEKLAYQSEIRSIIQSYHDLTGGLSPSSSSSASSEDVTTQRQRQPWPKDEEGATTDEDDESTEYEWRDQRNAGHDRDGVISQDFNVRESSSRGDLYARESSSRGDLNARESSRRDDVETTESFRSRARRNASFKKAVSSHRIAGSLGEELARSLEELHRGFVSLSRTGSVRSLRSSGLNSRTESMQSLTSKSSYGKSRDEGNRGGKEAARGRNYYPHEGDSDRHRGQSRKSDRDEPRGRCNDDLPQLRSHMRSRSEAGLNVLVRGLAPRSRPKTRNGRRPS